jgi:23S rRNA pseudoU1915 N3-methylase RlmH
MIHFEHIYTCEVILNTLPAHEQDCLIAKTLSIHEETTTMNQYLKTNKKISIAVYGKNYRDKTIVQKFNQLKKLGFTNVSIYFGGMFEWLMLQEIYGNDNFKTQGNTLDLLQFK